MNRSNTTSYDRRTLVEQREDRETTGPVLSKGHREHAVVPGSLRLGEVISTGLAEKIPFVMKLIDGRTLRGRIALRALAEDSLVKVYPSVIILGVDHDRG